MDRGTNCFLKNSGFSCLVSSCGQEQCLAFCLVSSRTQLVQAGRRSRLLLGVLGMFFFSPRAGLPSFTYIKSPGNHSWNTQVIRLCSSDHLQNDFPKNPKKGSGNAQVGPTWPPLRSVLSLLFLSEALSRPESAQTWHFLASGVGP